jgi:hypothetical protein
MIIQKKQSIIAYKADRSFNLMREPLNDRLNFVYHNFLNNVLCIYGDQKKNGSIPVFWTKNIVGSTNRSPHESSTLTELSPNQTYYILLINENKIPIEIPEHITSKEFLQTESIESNCELTDYCDGQPVIGSTSHRNIVLTQASGYSYNIDIPITNLYPNTSYDFSITSNYSNWPAQLSTTLGSIERASLTNNIGYTSGVLRSVFSYIPSGSSLSNSIPYSGIDTNDVFYTKNIFSILNLSIYSDNKLLIKDTINIKCYDCLPIDKIDNPTITLSQKEGIKTNVVQLSGINNLSTSVFATYDKLDSTKTYELEFDSLGSNWPCFIGPKNIFVKPQKLYSVSGITYGSGSVEAIFRFSPISNPSGSWSNLPYNLDSFYNEEFIKQNLYNNLQVKLKDVDNIYSDSLMIRGIDNISPETQCVDKLVIKFDNSNLSYPVLTTINRPGSEFTLDKTCCSKDQILNISINGACCGSNYNYYFSSSNPSVSIAPSSGVVAFGDGSGRVSCVYNLNGVPGATIRFKLQDSKNNQFATDDIIVRCKDALV